MILYIYIQYIHLYIHTYYTVHTVALRLDRVKMTPSLLNHGLLKLK
jgi:hypothetical protein